MDSLDAKTQEIQTLFYQGAYQACVDEARLNSSGSLADTGVQQRLLYGARAAIAINDTAAAQALLPSDSIDSSAAQAVRFLATFVAAQIASDADKADDALVDLHMVLDNAVLGDLDGQTIRVCVATAMARDNDPVGALEVLGMGQGTSKELECIALGVHILLSINRLDVAQKEYNAARVWADDSLLIQLIEALIGIYEGGRAAQQAYYVYDELAQTPSQAGQASIVTALTGKAVARMVSAEYVDASSALTDAHALDATNGDVLANRVPLSTLATTTGQSEALKQAIAELRAAAPRHALIADLDEKEKLFDEAFGKHKEALSAST